MDRENKFAEQGINLRRMRNFIQDECQRSVKDLELEVDLNEDQQYALMLKLSKLQWYVTLKNEFTAGAKLKYEEEFHSVMLEDLWELLKPGARRESRITKQWIDIGFQGADPVTDLRGTGLLGLKMLHSFVKVHTKKVTPMFQLSC